MILLVHQKREEELFIANLLADLLHEYVLRVNGKWLEAQNGL